MLPQLDIKLLTFDVTRIGPDWGTRDHCDPYWRLYANGGSGGYLELAEGRHVLTANRIHIVPAWVKLHCRSRAVCEHFYVHYDVLGLSGPVVREIFKQPQTLRKAVRYAEIVKPVGGGISPSRRLDLAAIMYVKALVHDAFSAALLELSPSQLARLQQFVAGNDRFAQVARHIEHHLHDPLDNHSLAKLAHMSKSHFIRCFHAAFGQTPASYVTEKRVAAAAKLLRFTDRGIDCIAKEVGFSNRFYFTRVFTRLMGISPGGYRKVEKGGQAFLSVYL